MLGLSWGAILSLAAAVQVADIISTVIALRNGAGVESNPIIRAAMRFGPWGWVAFKLALAGASYWLAWSGGYRALAVFLTVFMALIVANNFRHILR